MNEPTGMPRNPVFDLPPPRYRMPEPKSKSEFHHLISRHDWMVLMLFAIIMAVGIAFCLLVYLNDA